MALIDTKHIREVLRELLAQTLSGRAKNLNDDAMHGARTGSIASIVFIAYFLSLIEERPLQAVLEDIDIPEAEHIASKFTPSFKNANLTEMRAEKDVLSVVALLKLLQMNVEAGSRPPPHIEEQFSSDYTNGVKVGVMTSSAMFCALLSTRTRFTLEELHATIGLPEGVPPVPAAVAETLADL